MSASQVSASRACFAAAAGLLLAAPQDHVVAQAQPLGQLRQRRRRHEVGLDLRLLALARGRERAEQRVRRPPARAPRRRGTRATRCRSRRRSGPRAPSTCASARARAARGRGSGSRGAPRARRTAACSGTTCPPPTCSRWLSMMRSALGGVLVAHRQADFAERAHGERKHPGGRARTCARCRRRGCRAAPARRWPRCRTACGRSR